MRLFLSFILCSSIAFGQKQTPFTGKLVYSVTITDTAFSSIFTEKQMVVYTNDTLVRIENMTEQFGMQVAIRHLELNKSYLLISTFKGDFAIQTKFETDEIKTSKFTFKKKFGSTKLGGQKAKKLEVTHEGFEQPMTFYYFKKTKAKYLDGFENFPGLLAEYYIPTPDGIFKYTLISIENDPTNIDLYGIPADFKKISIEDFVNLMTGDEEGN